ncbi:MAG: 30S ribosomal protein THX [Bacteroidales bacterium]|nr:30S ribosomal protein THX [Bacteroidales bacterium]
MGKGDKKSKRGKIIRGSYGVRRRRKTKNNLTTAGISQTNNKKDPVNTETTIVKEGKPGIVPEIKKDKTTKAELKPEKPKAEHVETKGEPKPVAKPKAKKSSEQTAKPIKE